MKKLAIAALAVVTFSLASCKKDYTCKCEKTYTKGGTTITNEDGSYPFKDTRTKADSRCSDQEKTGSDAFGDYVRNCDIQ